MLTTEQHERLTDLAEASKFSKRKAPKGKLVVRLAAMPNPDMPRDHRFHRPIFEPAKNLKDASAKAQAFRDKNDLGGGNWVAGEVYNDKGKQVARISYNGRVWTPDGKAIDGAALMSLGEGLAEPDNGCV